MKTMQAKGLFTLAHIERLKAEMGKIDRVDPCSPAFEKMRAYVEGLPSPLLCQFIGHKIKWLQTLAVTALRKRGELPTEAGILHAVEVVLSNEQKRLA